MTEIIYVTHVSPLEGHKIHATFSDGAVKDIDLAEVLSAGGVLTPIYERREFFEQVHVNPESRTVEWPGEVDLEPEVLYGRYEPASGHRIARRRSPAQRVIVETRPRSSLRMASNASGEPATGRRLRRGGRRSDQCSIPSCACRRRWR